MTAYSMQNSSISNDLKKHDWPMFFMGLLLVVCAIVIISWPGATLVTLAIFAGVLFLLAGGADIAAFLASKGVSGRGWILANAIIDLVLGCMFLIHPIAAASVLPWLAGAFVVAYGIIAIVASIGLRSFGSLWVLMLINGILSIVIGILFVVNPALFAVFLGVFVALRGVLMCIYGFMGYSVS